MTSPLSASPVRRIVLVPSAPQDGQPDAVRRYRFARLRLEDRDVPEAARFSHLKRQDG